jgi:hypothetical protein
VDDARAGRRILPLSKSTSCLGLFLLCALLLGAAAGIPVQAALEHVVGSAALARGTLSQQHAASSWPRPADDAPVRLDHRSTAEVVARYIHLVLAPQVFALEADVVL